MSNNNHIVDFLNKLHDGEGKGYSIYFLGIGGIGMSAIARYFNSRGVKVSGYDKTETALTKQLINEGIAIHYEDDVELIDKEATLVVYTPAIPNDHAEYNFYKENGFAILKRSEVLGLITNSSFNVCVAGTHGKTTTSSMIAHLLRDSKYGCNAFLGGIASNYDTNFWSDKNNTCVVEADEYDRSFLRLMPDIAVITAIDADHLDIYGTEEKFAEAFVEFTEKIKTGGLLICKKGLETKYKFSNAKTITYSLNDKNADCYAENIRINEGTYVFDVVVKGYFIVDIKLNMGGLHNIENAVASIVAALKIGIEEEKIKNAVSCFKGVKRRFEYIIKNESIVMIDDYAHHPQELTALITSAKDLYKNKKCTVVFQPHLYSRTRDFAEGFAQALSLADEVYLLPIYPAREKPIEGVRSEMIAEKMEDNVECTNKNDLQKKMIEKKKNKDLELLIMAGAGDIDTLVTPIKDILVNN